MTGPLGGGLRPPKGDMMRKVVSILIITIILVAGMVLPSNAVNFTYSTAENPYQYWLKVSFATGQYDWTIYSTKPCIMVEDNGTYSIELHYDGVPYKFQYYLWNNAPYITHEEYNTSDINVVSSNAQPTEITANYSIGTFTNKSLELQLQPQYFIYNTSELANRTITVNQTGVDKTKQITCTVTNPQGIQSTVMQNWQFNSSIISLWQLNPNLSFWTQGDYNITVSCDGVSDTGVFGLSRTDVQDNLTVTDSTGTSYTVDAVKQAYIASPHRGDYKSGRFYIQIKTNGQPYRLPNGKSTYSIYYYFQDNKLINGTLYSDITMTNKEERYWYSSSTIGIKNLVLYCGENVNGTALSGSSGVDAMTSISTWQHPVSGKWFVPIDIVPFNYGSAATIEDEANGNVSPWQEPGQTAWEAIVNTTQGGVSYTMPGINFDFTSVTESIVNFMSGFSGFFSAIGGLFTFIPIEIMGLAITGATLSLALIIFRR